MFSLRVIGFTLLAATTFALLNVVVVVTAADPNVGPRQAHLQTFTPHPLGSAPIEPISPQPVFAPTPATFVPQFTPQIKQQPQQQPKQTTHKKRLGRRWRRSQKRKQEMANPSSQLANHGHNSVVKSIRAKVAEAQTKIAEAQKILDEISTQLLADDSQSAQNQSDHHDEHELYEDYDDQMEDDEDDLDYEDFDHAHSNEEQPEKIHQSGGPASSPSLNQTAFSPILARDIQRENPTLVSASNRPVVSSPIFSGSQHESMPVMNATITNPTVYPGTNSPLQTNALQPLGAPKSGYREAVSGQVSELEPFEKANDHSASKQGAAQASNPYSPSLPNSSSGSPNSPPSNSDLKIASVTDRTVQDLNQQSSPKAGPQAGWQTMKAEELNPYTRSNNPVHASSGKPEFDLSSEDRNPSAKRSQQGTPVVDTNPPGTKSEPPVTVRAAQEDSNNPYVNQPSINQPALKEKRPIVTFPSINEVFGSAIPASRSASPSQVQLESPTIPEQHQTVYEGNNYEYGEEDDDDYDYGDDVSELDEQELLDEQESNDRGYNPARKSRAMSEDSDTGSMEEMPGVHHPHQAPPSGRHMKEDINELPELPAALSNNKRHQEPDYHATENRPAHQNPFALPISRNGAKQEVPRGPQQSSSPGLKSFAPPGGYSANNQQPYLQPYSDQQQQQRQPTQRQFPPLNSLDPLHPLGAIQRAEDHYEDEDDDDERDGYDQDDVGDPHFDEPSDGGRSGKRKRGSRFKKFYTNRVNQLKHVGRKLVNSNHLIHDAVEKTRYHAGPHVRSMLDQTRQAAHAVHSRLRPSLGGRRQHSWNGHHSPPSVALGQGDSLTLSRTIPDRLGQYPMVPALNNHHQPQIHNTISHQQQRHFDTGSVQTRDGLGQGRTTGSLHESVSHSLDGRQSSFKRRSSSFSYSTSSSSA